MATFGEKLKSLRVESKGISIAEAAKQLGVPKPTYNNWERDSSKPPLEMLCKIATFYNTTLDYLAGYEPDPELVELVSAVRSLPEVQRDSIKAIVDGLKKKK